MSWQVAQLPGFITQDAALMVAELLAFQVHAMRQAVINERVYAETYEAVFAIQDPVQWLHQPPPVVAHGLTEIIRTVGLFVLVDDDVALDTLYRESAWHAVLPPVPVGRPGPIYTPSRAQQQENRATFEALVHRAAAMTYAERLPSIAIDTIAEANRLYETVGTMFDAVIDEANARNDGTARTLRQIKATTWQLIDRRSLSARDEGVMQLSRSLPSLVCAHLAYREARQAKLVRSANPTAHPNFMPTLLTLPQWP